MKQSCWSCKHCINDYFATGTMDCKKQDDMTEDEFENYYGDNGGENCPYYEEDTREQNVYFIEKIKNMEDKIMKLYVSDKETGTFIEEVKTIEDGKKLISQYEETDKADGTYTENFYDIVDEEHCSVS